MRIRTFLVMLAIAPLGLAACGNSDNKSDTSAATEAAASEVTETEAAPGSEAAAETEAAESEAAETEVAAAETEAAAAETEVAAVSEAAAGGNDPVAAAMAGMSKGDLITAMLSSMTNGAPPTQTDIDCMTKNFSDDDLAVFVKSVSAGSEAGPPPEALKPIIKAAVKCKPAGFVDSITSSLGSDDGATNALNETEKTCLSNGLLGLFNDDKLLDVLVAQGAGDLPAEIRADLAKRSTPVVEKCVSDKGIQAKILAEMQE
jgi:hypothetical protein